MAATIEVPASRPARPRHRRFPAQITVAVALVLAVTAAVILITVWRGLAPAPAGHRTGTPIVVPHPAPDRPEADHQRPKHSAHSQAAATAAQAPALLSASWREVRQ